MKTRIVLFLILGCSVPVSLAFAAHAAKLAASHNWAGYVAQGSGYSAVEGSWVVPDAEISSTTSASAVWVGIGGMQDKDLIQAGTRAQSEGGRLSYEAWYELYPAPAVLLPVAIHAGDTIRVAITEASGGVWEITIVDGTAGSSFSTTQNYASTGGSAEWIVEAPGTAAGSLLALGSFTPVNFLEASAVRAGTRKSPAALGATGLSLVDPAGAVLAAPSPLQATQGGFTVVRQ